jgi:dihydroorotase
MIDPHVHCRDWAQSHKETIAHALSVAERTGLSGIFDMPNTFPPINSREFVKKRLADAYKTNSPVFYGVYAGITSNPNQIREIVKAQREFFPNVVGLKMFAGHSVGNLGIIKEEEQRVVYQTLSDEGYDGVLVVHCEKESLLKPNLWNPLNPKSHSYARPNESEVESVRDQIDFATEYQFIGMLHITHISVPESVALVDRARQRGDMGISCGLTPHHCLLSYDLIPESKDGLVYKVNPPLRDENSSGKMLELLRQGKIDWIETDHAPHTLKEKTGEAFDANEKPRYMSGFPGLPFYPHFIDYLRRNGFSEERIRELTHTNIEKIFGINLPERNINPDRELHTEYEVDVYKGIRK